MRKIYNSTPERTKVYYERKKAKGLCYTCGRNPSSNEITKFGKSSKQCNECRIKRAKQYQKVGKVINQDRKLKAFLRYGGIYCVCCGISNPVFLSLDHIENNGSKHRKTVGKRAANFYTWLEENNYPPGLQVMCHNCNHGKFINGGICPHQYEKTTA